MQEIREGLALPDWNGKVPFDGLWGYYSDSRSRHPDVRYYGFKITNGATGGVDIAETETVIGVWWRLVQQRGIIDALMYRQWFRFLHDAAQQRMRMATDESNDPEILCHKGP